MNFYFTRPSAERLSPMMTNYKNLMVGFAIIFILMMPTQADIRRDCRKQTNVSWSALKKLKSGNFNQDDPKLKCYLRCFMMKNGIIGSNNEIDVEKALRHLPPGLQESSRKVLGQCKNIPGKNSCDKAYQIVRCYFKFQPQILKSVAFV